MSAGPVSVHRSDESGISLRCAAINFRQWDIFLRLPDKPTFFFANQPLSALVWSMSQDLRERGRWLARNVLPHEALLRAKLRSMCLYDLDVEDVIQETYARFMTHPALDSIRFPRQYALLTARGIIIDHVRHSRVVSITSSGNLEMLEIPASNMNSEERVEFQQEIQAVVAALDDLPKTCRETLVLRRIEGLPQREVARRLNISEKTVEKHMATGVRLLIKLFGRGGKVRANSSTTQDVDSSEDVGKNPRD